LSTSRARTLEAACLWITMLALAAVGCKGAQPSEAQPEQLEVERCSAWLDFVCKHVADQDPLCLQVQEGISVLTEDTCAVAYAQRAFTEQQLDKRKQQCGVLVERLCADMPGETRSCNMLRGRVTRYTPNYCVDMLAQYAQTLATLREQATAPRLPPEKAALLYAGDPPSFGPVDAKIQLVEFLDYESIYSPKTAAIIRSLAAKYKDDLRFVVRQYALPDNPHSHIAAEAALAAQAQRKYWPMHDKLLENHKQLDRDSLLRYAKELGLDTKQLIAALDSKRYAAAVDADIALAKTLEVVGMPTLFVNNERIGNSVDENSIVAAIEEHLARVR
jgi:protein-disulfide isomerase